MKEKDFKVLFLTHGFPRHKSDSITPFIFDIAKGVSDKRIKVFVLAPHSKGLERHEVMDDIEVFRFRYAPGKFETLSYSGRMHSDVLRSSKNKVLFFLFLFFFFVEGLYIAKTKNIDLIHAHWILPGGIVGMVISVLLSKPLVVSSHGTDLFIAKKFGFLVPIIRVILEISRGIHVISFPLKVIVCDLKVRNMKKVFVIPEPVNVSEFSEVSYSENRRAKEKTSLNVLFIGRLIERKGVEYLLKAGNIIDNKGVNFVMKIVGVGELKSGLCKMSNDLSLSRKVVFIDSIAHKDIKEVYRWADVLVLPSVTDWKGEKEGLGVVILEAFASGIPVIGTRSGGIVDVVKDNVNGYLVPEKDAEAIAKYLVKISEDRNLARKLGCKGREFVQAVFARDKVAEKIIGMYKNSIKRNIVK